MEWKELQPFATIIAAIIAGVITAIVTLKIQDKKRNDDTDLKAFDHSLTKRLKEFEQKLIGDNSYLSEKGKNEAIKEDLDEINRKIESIRNEYTTHTELLKWQLSKKGNLHKLQAEKEFEVYSKIWDLVTELRFSLEKLRPSFDYIEPNESKREKWLGRYREVVQKVQNLQSEIEKHRPFYPHDLYLQLRELINKVSEEVLDFEFSLDEKQEKCLTKDIKEDVKISCKLRNIYMRFAK